MFLCHLRFSLYHCFVMTSQSVLHHFRYELQGIVICLCLYIFFRLQSVTCTCVDVCALSAFTGSCFTRRLTKIRSMCASPPPLTIGGSVFAILSACLASSSRSSRAWTPSDAYVPCVVCPWRTPSSSHRVDIDSATFVCRSISGKKERNKSFI